MQKFTIESECSNGDRYRIEDIWAVDLAEALWIAYGRALEDRRQRIPAGFPSDFGRFGGRSS